MSEPRPPDRNSEHAFSHSLTILSVSSGMIGVCLTAIGLVRVFTHMSSVDTLCDDLIVVDSLLFGVAALLGFRNLDRFVRRRKEVSLFVMDLVFLIALALMIVVCGFFAWSVI